MIEKLHADVDNAQKDFQSKHQQFSASQAALEKYIKDGGKSKKARDDFEAGYRAAWDKLDDDLFNTARLITCGMYIQISIHDYLRALMGFHQWNTNFTLEPRADIDHHNVSRGIGNQVTVEFNLLYRFHCAISLKDEAYTRRFIEKKFGVPDANALTLENFMMAMKIPRAKAEPWDCVFGIPEEKGNDFQRNPVTGLFNDQEMINALMAAMDDPISNFGPRNVPKCLKAVEVMGIVQARKWQIGTLNDFREFFDMPRHDTFESVTKSVEIQNALRDLYEHPDKIELYPGVFCESDNKMGLDPGPSDVDSALWAAIFSDAITLVRSDRFYTTDWNTHSLTAWGMKEVTPDNDICKSSVFHRLIQRAFPEWYPYNSVQFFHPFYTTQTNTKFAADQGYASMFRMSAKPTVHPGEEAISKFEVDKSKPRKPWKPHYLKDKKSIDYVLNDMENFLHPALNDMTNLPDCFQGLYQKPVVKAGVSHAAVKEDEVAIMAYFNKLMKDIIKRESIPMDSATLQIDATRDFAIPVVTRYVADFLGIGHLLRTPEHPKAPYTENEIYQHIENCQIFLCYNSDETKLLKRRKAFTTSLKALHDLVLQGNIGEANRTSLGKYLLGRSRDNPMTQLGFQVADRVISHQPDRNAAASIMVFVGLHIAYNSVLGFTSTLNYFLQEMYDFANPELRLKELTGTPQWLQVQKLAFPNHETHEKEIKQLVVDAERKSIKLPLVLIARNEKKYGNLTIGKDHIVICDIFKANAFIDASTTSPKEFISHKHSATSSFADYEPKRIAEFGVTAMIKFFAQMRNPRRGHDAQGRLKKVRIDASAEGYSNYMAPMRISRIAEDVKKLGSKAEDVYSNEILKPETDTYLTAEWNEMVPFPNTWKIRYDGFGRSDYSCKIKNVSQPYGKLRLPVIPDDAPPFYQPQGASHTGGTFADISCTCTSMGVVPVVQKTGDGKEEVKLQKVDVDAAEREPTLTTGCGMGK